MNKKISKYRPKKYFGMTGKQIGILIILLEVSCFIVAGFVFVVMYSTQFLPVNPADSPSLPTIGVRYTSTLQPSVKNTFTPKPTFTPSLTRTKSPTNTPSSTPTSTQIPTPTVFSFFPSLPRVAINSQNYPQVYDPPSYIQNPERYRNSRLSITLYVVKIVNARINGEKQVIVSMNTQMKNPPYMPVLVFGLKSKSSYINIFEIGDMVTIYGVGMGSVDRQTLNSLFGGSALLPSGYYTNNTNWAVACIFGEDYFVH